MLERILKRVREKIRARQFVMTLHADEEMNNDELTIYDVEHAVLTGKIVERQRDMLTSESKYRIRGETVEDEKIEVIVTVYKP